MGSVAAASSLVGTLVALPPQPVVVAMKSTVRSKLAVQKQVRFIEALGLNDN